MNKLLLTTVISSSILLAACNPDTPPSSGILPVSPTVKGAIIGGAVGAGVGSLGRSTGATVAGGVAGAALGALVAHHISKNDKPLETHTHGSGVQLIRHGSETKLLMPSSINFASGSSHLSPRYYPMLAGLGELLRANPDTFIQVIGYADGSGSDEQNQRISLARAHAVARYLEVQQHIVRERIHIVGRGNAAPVASNGRTRGRLENRRVVIKVWPIQKRA